MFNIWNHTHLSRRQLLQAGALSTGLVLSDVLRARADAPSTRPRKSVIMIYLPGGPSHIDMYDLKPDAPAEYRGEFRPIRTNVPGMDVCELMPGHARLADKFTIVRGLQTYGNHDPYQLLTGGRAVASGQIGPAPRPCFGSVISRLRPAGVLPEYVSLGDHRLLRSYDDPETPAYLGAASRPFRPSGPDLANLRLADGVTIDNLADRRTLLQQFDTLRRDIDDQTRVIAGMDRFTAQAIDMITSSRTRDAFDLAHEPARTRERFGEYPEYLLARRLVQAGVSVVSLASRFPVRIAEAGDPGGWDTHAHNFAFLRAKLPRYDFAVSALIADLHDRGMLDDVAVVIWGEFGRQPRIGDVTPDGRGHWPSAGFAFIAGGGMRMGQVIGATDARGERPRGRAYAPQDVLATLYRLLDVPLSTTLPDHTGRPQFLLDQGQPLAELLEVN